MTKVDFYILTENSSRNIESLTCQLTEKAYQQNNFVYIQSQTLDQAYSLDEFLWKYKADSFLPHLHILDIDLEIDLEVDVVQASKENSSINTNMNFDYPILISNNKTIASNYNPKKLNEVLINLSNATPEFFSQFHRLAEIINYDENAKQLARQRFRFYKDRGYQVSTHHV